MRSVSVACRASARYAPLDRRQKAIVCPTWPAPPISGPGEPLQHQHYVQRSGTVNALDAGHLDVGGSGGSGDGGERRRAELLHAADGFRQGFHDLLRPFVAWLGATYGRRIVRLFSGALQKWSTPLLCVFMS